MFSHKILKPGDTIGILGGGQLARMLALAAAPLGLKCHIFAPESDSPAFQVSDAKTVADYADETALQNFASKVDSITYEFENVPVAAVQFLENLVAVRPNSKALSVAQDRIAEKTLARKLGAMTAEFASVNSVDDFKKAVAQIGLPAILKTVRFGYDGKGQVKIFEDTKLETAWDALQHQPAILESFVNFQAEVSVICARSIDGNVAAYDVTENVHRNHILSTSTVPSNVDDSLQTEAIYVAQQILTALDYVGVMAVEFFVGHDVIYVNEIAPRVHNSGHWTQDGCTVSQFQQHMRAVAGWPLGATRRHSNVIMTNLLGDDILAYENLARMPNIGIHLYGKSEARAGRKMGHFNRVSPRKAN